MMEESPNRSFEKYIAAKRAVTSYGLSEEFEEDQLFTTASSNPTLQLSRARVPRLFKGPAIRFSALPTIEPSYAVITSGSPDDLFTVTRSTGMVSEPPVITVEQSVDEVIRRIRTTLPDRYRQKLSARISELQQAVKEEELNGLGIDAGSLGQFVDLLKAFPTLRCPTVSVTPERNIDASWKAGRDRVFSIHFLPDGRVRFVIFYPNTEHAGEVIRVSGVATADVVINVVAPHGILIWASE